MKTQILKISTNESVDSISSNNLAPYPGQYVARAAVQAFVLLEGRLAFCMREQGRCIEGFVCYACEMCGQHRD